MGRLQGGEDQVEVWSVAFHPDGDHLLTTSDSAAQAHYWSITPEGTAEVAWKRSCGGGPSGFRASLENGGAWVALSSRACGRPSEIVEADTGRVLFRSGLGNDSWLCATPSGERIVDATRDDLSVSGERSIRLHHPR